MRGIGLFLLAALALARPAAAQNEPGRTVFRNWCAACHAPTGPGERLAGTTVLEGRYKGEKPAALEQRTDLTPAVVKLFVRHGVKSMPPFRKTEISDADLDALSLYLSRTAR